MPVSYEVGAVFRVVDEASSPLQRIAQQLRELNALVDDTKASLRTLTEGAFAGFAGRVDGAIRSLAELGRVAESASGKVLGIGEAGDRGLQSLGVATSGMSDLLKAVGASAEGAAATITSAFEAAARNSAAAFERLDAKMAAAGEAGAAAAAVPLLAGGGGGGNGGGGGKGGGHGGRGGMFHGHVPTPVHGVRMGGDGMVPMAVGGFTLYELVKHGFEAQHAIAIMQGQGATDEQQRAAMDAAAKQAGVNSNTSITGNLETIIESYKAVGDWGEATRLLPVMSPIGSVLKTVKSDGLKATMNEKGQVLGFTRALEEMGVTQKGATDAEREASIQSYTADMIRTMIAQRGSIDGREFFNMTNNSGGASMNWDQRFATTVAPIIGAEIKAGKLGNADYMLLRSYQQGTIPAKTVAQMRGFDVNGKHISLLGDAETYHDKGGWHLNPNSAFAEGMQSNPWDWSAKLLGNLKAQGIDTSDQDTMNKIVNVIAPNKSTATMLRNLLEPNARALIQKDIEARDRVPKDAVSTMQANDPVMKIDAFKNKLSDLFTVLGGSLTGVAMDTLTHLTDALRGLSSVLEKNPTAQKAASWGVAGLAATAVINGVSKFVGLGGLFDGGTAAGGTAAGAAAGTAAGGGIKGFLAKGLKGGLWGGLAALGGEAALDYVMPLTPEAQKVIDKNSVGNYLSRAWNAVTNTPDRPAAQAQPWFRDFQNRESDASYMKMESSRGKALSNLPPPKIDVTLENHVNVYLDSVQIAGRIEAKIVQKFEHSTSAPASDTHGMFSDPDYGFSTG